MYIRHVFLSRNGSTLPATFVVSCFLEPWKGDTIGDQTFLNAFTPLDLKQRLDGIPYLDRWHYWSVFCDATQTQTQIGQAIIDQPRDRGSKLTWPCS
jgi:hypothetical protein